MDPEGEPDDRATEPVSEAPVSLRSPKTAPPASASPVTPRDISVAVTPDPIDEALDAGTDTSIDVQVPASREQRKPGDPDTLISAPRPAERDELEVKERFRLLEDRIDELDGRVRLLERRRPDESSPRSQPWWIWLIFLLGLAITWRLLEALR